MSKCVESIRHMALPVLTPITVPILMNCPPHGSLRIINGRMRYTTNILRSSTYYAPIWTLHRNRFVPWRKHMRNCKRSIPPYTASSLRQTRSRIQNRDRGTLLRRRSEERRSAIRGGPGKRLHTWIKLFMYRPPPYAPIADQITLPPRKKSVSTYRKILSFSLPHT